ncbi:hypothetical protein [Streptantibioticus silvisoli]|uniref:Uncharacterized protein n=1 Tax=Streptantibioticus silvisoli TaxID=2705255 RepID=A0ABT6VXS7_9ACTN|nr:hypothetical protein [Streptantibioticus silvisoli]MDI5962253.1 hypothetical protein [Streptantibioticus silvisoli]
MAELGSGGVLLDTGRPAAAYLSPTALGWLRGRPPAAEHHAQHTHCFTQWRAAGFLAPDTVSAGPAAHDDLRAQAADCAPSARHPVLVIAMATACGFCTQLTADLAANAPGLTHLDASVLLVDGDDTRALGRPLAEPARRRLARLGRRAAQQGTPTAVLLSPDRPPRVLTGFDEVGHALVELSGADPRATVIEAPTSCSVNVAAQPVDALLTARVNGTRLGIAVRGGEVRRIVETAGGLSDSGYTPVTLTVERPDTFYLLFRGGELLTRARTADALRQSLAAVLAGYASHASPERGTVPLLCGAAVHDGGHAVLFPRTWMSDLVKRARQLERAGWRLPPEPYTTLRASPTTGALHLPDPARPEDPGHAVTAVLTEPPQTGTPTRARLLASIVNWIARPAATDAIHTLAAFLDPLPVRAGTWQEALTHLTGPRTPEDDRGSPHRGGSTTAPERPQAPGN